jgi:tryptophanyl-tRNA synthetase
VRADIPGTVEGNPVFAYHDAFNPDRAEVEDLKDRYQRGKVGDVEVKSSLARAVNTFLDPMRRRRMEYARQPDRVEAILRSGTGRARNEAASTMDAVRRAMGMYRVPGL